MTIRQRLENDHRVLEVWSEANLGDGYWVSLKKGFADFGFDSWHPTHTIHEWTWKAVLERMKEVGPCFCPDCHRPPRSP